jgi:cellulose synthase (UDP-forming)
MKSSNLLVQLLIFGAVVAALAVGFLTLTHSSSFETAMQAGLHTGKAGTSITDIAASYYGTLTRPLFPDISLWFPLGFQMFVSLAIILTMGFTGLFFPQARGVIILLTVFSLARHVLWRGVDTLNLSNPVLASLSMIVYAAEVLSLVSLVLGYFQIWKLSDRKAEPIALDGSKPIPTVDVFVCTYNEPVSVVYRTLVGCQNLDYPHKQVYLLDDGRRPEMVELAAHLGVRYVSREKNTHAKAGNLNNAMGLSDGELVLVFDADHVPCRTFLNETVGFFQKDEYLSFVQTPQHFFTIDPFQRNLLAEDVVSNEQDYFFHIIQPGNDHWNAAFFAGSGAIFRRDSLQSVGGFATETITEDVHTGIRLHANGWRSALYNKNLAAGMAQDSFADFVKQRLRWARGMTQIFFHDNPLFVKGLSLAQRICYFSGILYFFNGIQRFVFLVAPLFFLLFGFMTIDAGIVELATYYAPSFLCLFWGYSILTKGYRHLFWAEVYETALCVYMSLASIGSLISPKRSKFMVTPKGTVSERLFFNWKIVIPQILIAALLVIGLGMAAYRAFLSPDYLPGILSNLIWASYNLVLLIAAIYVAQERPQFRLAPRVFKRIRCELRLLDGTIAVGYTTNLSETGLSLTFDEPVPIAGTMALKILDWDINETSIFQAQAVRSVVDKQNHHHVGLRVVNRSDEQHQKLIRHMFSSPEVWSEVRQDTGIKSSLWRFLTIPLRLGGTEEIALRRRTPRFQAQLPCVVEGANGQPVQCFTSELSETGLSLMVPVEAGLRTEQPTRLQVQWANGQVSMLSCIVRRIEEAGHGQQSVGLNFTQLTREQRLEIIRQIYGPREGLIRVAPAVSRMVPCAVVRSTGEVLSGTTQEMSEMGVRLYLKQSTQMRQEEPVKVQFQWEDGTITQLEGLLLVPENAQEMVTIGGAGQPPVIVYFRSASLKQLDDLSERMLLGTLNPALTQAV